MGYKKNIRITEVETKSVDFTCDRCGREASFDMEVFAREEGCYFEQETLNSYPPKDPHEVRTFVLCPHCVEALIVNLPKPEQEATTND